MSAEIMIPSGLMPSAKFAQSKVSHDDLGAGIQAAFAVISYKGKVWRVKHRGEEKMLMRPDEPGVPQPYIECVIVKASPVIAKIFYKGAYTEGDTAPPDCWSVNGVTPDPASPLKQANTCAGCPMNAWGSKITTNGKATKACADSKRLAIVPAIDMPNELYGGPMLLRVPPASLSDLSVYSEKLRALGVDYFSVVTRIGFDANEAFPKFTLAALRGLNDAEADVILPMQEDPRVTRILQEAVDHVRAEPPGAPAPTTANPAPGTAGAPVSKPVQETPKEAPKDDLEIPPHLRRNDGGRPATTDGLRPTTPDPVVTPVVTAPVPGPVDPMMAQMEALRAQLAQLQAQAAAGAAAGTTNGTGAAPVAAPVTSAPTPTPVVKRTRNKATQPTTPPPSPAPTPVEAVPVTTPVTTPVQTTLPVETAQNPAQPSEAKTLASEGLASIENELEGLL